MGSRADDKLKEIEDLRASLSNKLAEIEQRFPMAGMGKKIAMGLAGSSVASSALALGMRRRRSKKDAAKGITRKRKGQAAAMQPANVTVNVFPKGAAWLAAAGLAAWAGSKVYDAMKRSKDGDGSFRPAVVKQFESGRASDG